MVEQGRGWEAIVEGSIAIPPHSSPEPDIAVTSEAEGDGLMPLASVKLIVEVSDATLSFDTRRKAKLYAEAKVPEYWVVDVNAKRIRQLWAPDGDAYTERREIAFGDPVVAATIEAMRIDTANL